MMTTLDGFFEGPDHDISWHNTDMEFEKFAIEQLKTVDTILFGRVTYEMMASFWPSPAVLETDPETAKYMNELPKVVFSKTLYEADWQNTRLVKDNIKEEIRNLKAKTEKDIAIFGSSDLTVSLAELGLVDEYRIMVNPVVLGKGKTLMQGIKEQLKLKLIKSRTFANGNILLTYVPEK